MAARPILRICLAVATVGAALSGLAGDTTCVQAQAGPAASCRSACLSNYNQCRMNTKGSPICDAQYQGCLQTCVPR